MVETNIRVSLASLIDLHKQSLARFERISAQLEKASFSNDADLLEKEHEEASRAEFAALSAIMAFPVQSIEDARLKAAYFLSIENLCEFENEITQMFVRSFVTGP